MSSMEKKEDHLSSCNVQNLKQYIATTLRSGIMKAHLKHSPLFVAHVLERVRYNGNAHIEEIR